jgi:multidrug efflux pump subunit AcrA (membrane-fusion protein)
MTVEWYRRENAVARRRRMRDEQQLAREHQLLEWLAEAVPVAEMARRLGQSRNATYEQLDRALTRRAERDAPTVDKARVTWVDRLERLFSAYQARALGLGTGEDGEAGVPDLRAAELALKIYDRLAPIQGVAGPPSRHEIDLTIHKPDDIDSARQAILVELAKERAKHLTIDGHLAGVGTELARVVGEREEDDTPPPPGVAA